MKVRPRRASGLSKSLTVDVWSVRLAIILLSGIVFAVVVSAVLLAILGKTIPEPLTMIGSACMGAIGGIFLPSPQRR